MVFGVLAAAALSASCGSAGAQPPQTTGDSRGAASAQASLDWKSLEAPTLTDHVQLTSRDMFLKAGEAYFDPTGTWIIFQAVPVPTGGKTPEPFYSMYVAKLTKDMAGRIKGIEKPILVSPPGSYNTCGWFHPKQPYKIIFGSTLVPPSADQMSKFQVGQGRYQWSFPEETEVVERSVLEIFKDLTPNAPPVLWSQDATTPKPVFSRPDYDAECSYSRNGRFILYSHVREGRKAGGRADADIWVYDTQTSKQQVLVNADGYDGGPFWAPDGKRICYRSDRKGNDLLQVYVADLKFEGDVPTGVEHEYKITDNDAVNWAPFWDVTGSYLIYGTSEVSHANYEIFAVDARAERLRSGATPSDLKRHRITSADGTDILPVFSPEGRYMMWTAQRGPMVAGDQKPSSQLWIAQWNAGVSLFEPTPIGQDRAIEIAKAVAGEIAESKDSKITPKRDGENWQIFIDRGHSAGDQCVVVVTPKGELKKLMRGQ